MKNNDFIQSTFDKMKGPTGQELISQADILEQKQVNLTNKIEKWLANNTRATSEARSELKLYLNELNSGQITNGRYTEINNALTTIDTRMNSIGRLGKSLFQSLSEGAKKFTSWISDTAIGMRVITTIHTGIKTVRELDTALEIGRASCRERV